MAFSKHFSRRQFLTTAAVAAGGTLLAACQPKVVEVEKVVTQIVKEEVIVEGTPKIVEKVVEKVVEVAAPAEKAVDVRYMWWGSEQQRAIDMQLELFKDLAPNINMNSEVDADLKLASNQYYVKPFVTKRWLEATSGY